MQILRIILMLTLASYLCACSTAVSQYSLRNPGSQYNFDTCEMLKSSDNPPVIYSGAYTDLHNFIFFPFTAHGEGGLIALPLYPIILVIGVVDLPLSFVADTLILPYTIPYHTSLGCAEKDRIAAEELKRRRNTKTPFNFKGMVVDSETGMPIEGAIVLAYDWAKKINVIEGISDREGKVSIASTAPIEFEFPNIMVYKQGYFAQSNWGSEYLDVTLLSKFSWPDGYVFKMKKWRSKDDSWIGTKKYYHHDHYKFMYDVAAKAKSEGLPMLMDSILWEWNAPNSQ